MMMVVGTENGTKGTPEPYLYIMGRGGKGGGHVESMGNVDE